MKKTVMLLVFILLTATAQAGQDGIGVGVILGEPTGVSVKNWLDTRTAVDAAAAWSFSGQDSFQLHADYLIHPIDLPKIPEIKGQTTFYYGVGGRLKLQENDDHNSDNNDDRLGLRLPIGLSLLLSAVPVEFFVELVPILDLVPDTEFELNAAIGARYYFKIR